MEDPRQQQLMALQADISRITQALIEENASLKLQVNQLREEKSALVSRNRELGVREETLKLDKNTLELEDGTLKEKVKLQDPLVKNAALVRRRLYERTKELRGHGQANEAMVEAGNRAAHRGDYFADLAMFKLGYMKSEQPLPDPRMAETAFERVNKLVFKELYGSSVDHPDNPDHNLELIMQLCESSSKLLQYMNLEATIALSSPTTLTAPSDILLHSTLSVHRQACVRIFKQANTSDLFAALDTDANLEVSLEEVRQITERVVRNGKGRSHSRRMEARVPSNLG
ncbi:uncharacterized protein LY89DRAFT_737967 [Mollisia scopiformis]|uniref:Uncharacterized protein n=1 Tax=Mollisia scopiformis TaxID=149040 RepID=A0A194WYN3_MOLSC|nr:uncharacterized protein LY89DRAFT_737967 [Mollisia scopiformis]KUJ13071.1 hypothetical protein LY89DRAFT_737967 [Mollisia scopiformis]